MLKIRTYSELSKLKTFDERFKYLVLNGRVGADTFGWDRWLNQKFYKSDQWMRIRDQVIVRDEGCDLGVPGYEIRDKILIHHINPVTLDDIVNDSLDVFNPEYLICVSHKTHNAIHYGHKGDKLYPELVERSPNDTCPWRQ